MTVKVGCRPALCGLTELRLDYLDAKGVPSRRMVALISYGPLGIRAHCRLRGEVRTFRYDRVVNCVAADTGEYIDLAKTLKEDKQCDPDS